MQQRSGAMYARAAAPLDMVLACAVDCMFAPHPTLVTCTLPHRHREQSAVPAPEDIEAELRWPRGSVMRLLVPWVRGFDTPPEACWTSYLYILSIVSDNGCDTW
jgi:hypothetical protein